MTTNLQELEVAPSLSPIPKSTFEPVFKTGLAPTNITTHPGISEAATSDNIYIKSLVNMGWRWDTSATTGDSSIIRWNVGSTYEVPLDATGLPPLTTTPQWLSALQSASNDAFNAWAKVANIHPQFSATSPDITLHVVPVSSYNFGFGGYSGTPFDAAASENGGPVDYKNLTVAENGQVHVYFSDHAVGGSGPVWSVDTLVWSSNASGNPTLTDTGKEMFLHEIGHALGLKHPHDYGTSNWPYTFPGVDPTQPNADQQLGDNNLNSKLGTLMSYHEAVPPAHFGGAPGGPDVTPMAFDIAAIQTLYGANTNNGTGGNDTYTLSDPGSPEGSAWQSIWDTGGIDQIVYNGTANAVIDLRPATLDDSPTGGGMPSYTWTPFAVSRGGTIAGDITNALPDQGGVKGVVIENGIGGSGNDLITGNDADNLLEGNDGNDMISALAGNDIINGGPGNDTLFGGAGNNVFIFEPNSGHDTIGDFTVGQDLLDVAELGINDLSSFASNVQMAQVGTSTEITIPVAGFSTSVIDLTGVNVATLNSTDFRFV
jgi:Ca2+-binding RTX toxin-like protein